MKGLRFEDQGFECAGELTCCLKCVCDDRVLDGPASGEKGSKSRSWLDCIWGKRRTRSSPCASNASELRFWQLEALACMFVSRQIPGGGMDHTVEFDPFVKRQLASRN